MHIISDKIVKTRKPHRCFACLQMFEAGTTMRSQTNFYDGIATVYSCPTCDTLMGKFSKHFFDDIEMVFPEGCVREVMNDYKVTTPNELLTHWE